MKRFENKEEEELAKKAKETAGIMENMIRLFADITDLPIAKYKVAEIDFTDKLTRMSVDVHGINENQYKELTNMIKQFDTMLNDYLKENKIKLKSKEEVEAEIEKKWKENN